MFGMLDYRAKTFSTTELPYFDVRPDRVSDRDSDWQAVPASVAQSKNHSGLI
jgi:hypothetical protein